MVPVDRRPRTGGNREDCLLKTVLPLLADNSRSAAPDGGSVDRFSNGRPGSSPSGPFAVVESVANTLAIRCAAGEQLREVAAETGSVWVAAPNSARLPCR